MTVKLDESTQVKANAMFMLKTIGFVGSAVWLVAEFKADVQTLHTDVIRLNQQVELNSEFRIKWPRGEIGALPADAQQDMKIQHLEGRVDKLDGHVDNLRYQGTDKPKD
tara:strand:+ start:310 stop:636 length:327 start_codon:yes stop_codon:yes gene_type:complete